jgi:peptidyl-dipeptidase A
MAVNKILAETALLLKYKNSRDKQITDTLIQRQIEMIYASMVTKQVDTNLTKQISELQNKIEQKFSTYRAVIDGKKYTDNEIEEILHSSTDSKKLEKAWVSVKELGPVVAEDIKNLAKLRNQVAKSIGFNQLPGNELNAR